MGIVSIVLRFGQTWSWAGVDLTEIGESAD